MKYPIPSMYGIFTYMNGWCFKVFMWVFLHQGYMKTILNSGPVTAYDHPCFLLFYIPFPKVPKHQCQRLQRPIFWGVGEWRCGSREVNDERSLFNSTGKTPLWLESRSLTQHLSISMTPLLPWKHHNLYLLEATALRLWPWKSSYSQRLKGRSVLVTVNRFHVVHICQKLMALATDVNIVMLTDRSCSPSFWLSSGTFAKSLRLPKEWITLTWRFLYRRHAATMGLRAIECTSIIRELWALGQGFSLRRLQWFQVSLL